MAKPIIISKTRESTLAGHLLVATPQTQDVFFERSVVYLAAHNSEGAMGFIINAPVEKVAVDDILSQMDLQAPMGDRKLPIIFGGPVEVHRGFVLHNGKFEDPASISSRDGLVVTPNSQVLKDWIEGSFSAKAMLILGYAGWSAGQLESEIERGSWEVVPVSETIIFDTHHEAKWNLAIATLGFDLGNLSQIVGHA